MKLSTEIRYLKKTERYMEVNYPGGTDHGKILCALQQAIARAQCIDNPGKALDDAIERLKTIKSRRAK